MAQTLVVTDPLADLARLEGVPSAVAGAVDAVDAVLRDRGLRALPAGTVARSRLTGARGSAALTGEPEVWLPGALRLSAELDALAPLIRVAPGQALARAHLLLAQGATADAQLGRIADDPATAARMVGLVGLLTGRTVASAVVLGAVVHGEIATLAPFGSADALVARAAEHLVLIAGGVDPRGVVPVEAGHADAPAAYASGLQGYASGSAAEVRSWLVHCAGALSRGAELLAADPGPGPNPRR